MDAVCRCDQRKRYQQAIKATMYCEPDVEVTTRTCREVALAHGSLLILSVVRSCRIARVQQIQEMSV